MRGIFDWRSTPPVIFSAIVGALALGLTWIRAAPQLGVPEAFGWAIFGSAMLLYLVALSCYVAKVAARPGVLCEDLGAMPGRMGLSVAALVAMIFAAGIVPLAPVLAQWVLLASFAVQAALTSWIAWGMWQGGPETRAITPGLHLVFVGFIVGSQGTALLGWSVVTALLLLGTLVAALLIYGLTLEQRAWASLPPPMRPALMIHIAPLSLFGTTALMLGLEVVALIFAGLATGVSALLAGRLRWLTAAGFAPSWAAFTFPIVAYAGLMLMLGGVFAPVLWWGAAVLLAATLFIPWLIWRMLRLWASGTLSHQSGAARA